MPLVVLYQVCSASRAVSARAVGVIAATEGARIGKTNPARILCVCVCVCVIVDLQGRASSFKYTTRNADDVSLRKKGSECTTDTCQGWGHSFLERYVP